MVMLQDLQALSAGRVLRQQAAKDLSGKSFFKCLLLLLLLTFYFSFDSAQV